MAAVAASASPRLSPSLPQPQAAGMFISLPPWAVARNTGWPEQARIAARTGYAGIDWAFGPARAAGVEATRALLAELKIRATIVNLPMKEPLDVEESAFKAQLPKLRGGRGVLSGDRLPELPVRAAADDRRALQR